MRLHLDPALIGPDTDVYDRIERASSTVGVKIEAALRRGGQKLHWCYGDSDGWRVIISVPTELELSVFIEDGACADTARKILELIQSVVVLDEGFKLYLEVDTDERVLADEGWFLRLKSVPQREREFVFNRNGKSLTDA